MISVTLKQFIDDLTNDPQKWARFRTEPLAVIDEAGLSADDKAVLTTRCVDDVRRVLGVDQSRPSAVIIW